MNIEQQVQPILNIMNHENTVLIETTESLLLKSFKRVIEKKAPAHNKQSEADCLIVESLIEYFSKIKDKEKVFFITDNKTDFSDPEDQEKLHPHLIPIFNSIGIEYDLHLAKILKIEFGQKIDDDDVKFEEEIIKHPRGDFKYGFDPMLARGYIVTGFNVPNDIPNLTGLDPSKSQ